MNDGVSAKQQIVERIKENSNILVTVSTDPTVDELSAALGLTIMLNNLKKHATAVVSGKLPPAISFLEPTKTFENTVDSLRDFIIALDKEKADHLRYKVEGDVVKIFVTPYRTTITEDDLDFSQGDYNVELVLALGVRDEAHLDKALEAHGRILHDAAVATLTCGDGASSLGSISWHESTASSISEMLVALSESLKGDQPILDEQTSTALLTGIVASTDRFSNNKTSSKVMTMAAQLMAAGANQQLIAAKLEESHAISSSNDDNSDDDSGSGSQNKDGTTDLTEDKASKVSRRSGKKKKATAEQPKPAAPKPDDGTLAISHEPEGTLDEVAREVHNDNTAAAAEKAEDALAQQLNGAAPAAAAPQAAPTIEELQRDIASADADVTEASKQTDGIPLNQSGMPDYEPTFGGTLNATTEEAAEVKRREQANDQNRTILSHAAGQLSNNANPTFASVPFSATMQGSDAASTPPSDMTNVSSPAPLPPRSQPTLAPLPPAQDQPQSAPAAPEVPHEQALADVHAAFSSPLPSEVPASLPPLPQAAPASLPSALPPLPDFSTLPPAPAPFAPPAAPAAAAPAPVAAQPEQLGQVFGETPPQPAQPAAPTPAEPGQFKIPGQS